MKGCILNSNFKIGCWAVRKKTNKWRTKLEFRPQFDSHGGNCARQKFEGVFLKCPEVTKCTPSPRCQIPILIQVWNLLPKKFGSNRGGMGDGKPSLARFETLGPLKQAPKVGQVWAILAFLQIYLNSWTSPRAKLRGSQGGCEHKIANVLAKSIVQYKETFWKSTL